LFRRLDLRLAQGRLDNLPQVHTSCISGLLCVDHVYRGELATLLAVDPVTPGAGASRSWLRRS
jgi:hypothetical protein